MPQRSLVRTPARRRTRWSALVAAAAVAVAGTIVPATAAQADIGVDPLIHYTFDEATGTTIADASGNGNDGVLRQSGGTIDGGVLSLPGGPRGSAAYVEIPTAGLVGKKDLTISTWLSTRTGPANVAAAFIGAPVASGASFSSAYWLMNPTNLSGYVKSVVTNTVNAGSPWTTEVGAGATNTPTIGARTPAGMSLYTTVIDGTDGQLRVYINGALISQTSIGRNVASFGSSLVSYLGRSTYNDANWNGQIDDYAVYPAALETTEVAALFSGQAIDRAIGAVEIADTAIADFALPTSSYGVAIAWESDDAAIAVAGGAADVTRPASGSGDRTVTLTATFTAPDEVRTQTYTVVVPEDLADADKVAADLSALEIAGADDIRTNVSVPVTGTQGSEITWTVTEGAGFAALRAGVREGYQTVDIERPASGADAAEVELTATARNGSAEQSRTFRLAVQPMPTATDDTEAYVWAFFTGEGAGAERVSLAASKGNDALDWNTLNDGEPIFTSTQGTTGLRDPFIIRSPQGDRFYMLATDLKIDGLPGGFGTAQISGSRYIEVWESDDLVNWSEQRHVKVSSDFAGNTWAPEAYWDEELDTFVVFWASNLYDTPNAADRTAVTYNRMMYVTTDDFRTFSEPQPWIDVRRGNGLGTIDSTVAKVGDTYYRFTKDEASMTIRQEKSTDLLATITGTLPGTSGPADEWTLVKERIASGLPNGEPGRTYSSGEGPSVFPANAGDVNGFDWFLFIDQPSYHGGPNHYIPFGSDDIADGNSWQPLGAKLRANLPENSDGGKPRHGTVIPVTRAEYQRVLEAYAPDLAVTSVAAIDVTTTAGTAPALPQATLTKADGSTQTVDVVWDAVDPASYAVAGSFTVAGVAQDDSRMPVEATVTVEDPVSIEVTTDSRCVVGKVALTVKIVGDPDVPVSVDIVTAYGSRTATIGAGKTASYAFSSRLATMPAGSVSVTPSVDGESLAPVVAGYSGRGC
ncbi:immunoglobulin-like domain-containing protein [Microbacterium sp. CCNWLW134]|uniref:immunoglobulin-like domain-containing protein n=1 Tax=Microbacterium sp. CCNWLW134 TaxID=3122064 RepID=UPI0030103C21